MRGLLAAEALVDAGTRRLVLLEREHEASVGVFKPGVQVRALRGWLSAR